MHAQKFYSTPKWVRIPYLGKGSETLARYLRTFGYKAAYYPLLQLSRLSNLKDRIPSDQQPGIYRLQCGHCPKVYIGQTGRSLSVRLQEHRLDYTRLHDGRPDLLSSRPSAMALHCHTENHSFNDVEARIIHRCSKSSTMNHLEEAEILIAAKSSGSNLLNRLEYTLKNPLITYYLGCNETYD
jgi:hypothetical protein